MSLLSQMLTILESVLLSRWALVALVAVAVFMFARGALAIGTWAVDLRAAVLRNSAQSRPMPADPGAWRSIPSFIRWHGT